MSLLGQLISVNSASRAGDALTGVTFETRLHSLRTTPELVIPVLRSVQAIGINAIPQLAWVGANASAATIAIAVPSTASAPVIMYDVASFYFHTIIK